LIRSGLAPADTLGDVGSPQPPQGPAGKMSDPEPAKGAPLPGQPTPSMPQLPPPPPVGRSTRPNRLLLIMLVLAALLVGIGAGAAFLLYSRATEIDRSTPTIAVHQFLRATFVDKNDDRVELFTCSQWTKERTVEVQGRFDPEVKVTWESVALQSQQERQAVVTARMRLVFQGFVDFEDWRFEVVEDNGWRVCEAGPA